jgi:hypothetical protein
MDINGCLLSETKINYWFKHLLNCNISAILVAEINGCNEEYYSFIELNWVKFIIYSISITARYVLITVPVPILSRLSWIWSNDVDGTQMVNF